MTVEERDTSKSRDHFWPQLDFSAWQPTAETLHLWTQIVGKVRLAQAPWLNHSWHVTLYVTARGLTTSPMSSGLRTFQIDFDFIDHELRIETCDGGRRALRLEPMTTAAFHERLFALLTELDLEVTIGPTPNEVESAIPFASDTEHRSYDREAVYRFWRVLLQADRIFKHFRAGFLGKASPVHFFWGSFDLAVTRFSGRPAPEHPGGFPNLPDWVTREAYSHEVSSAGFWPGAAEMPAIFYSYAYPTPEGFADQPVRPEAAKWSTELGEFVLPYEAVRTAPDPDAALLAFLESTYQAAATTGGWDRDGLELRRRLPPAKSGRGA